MLIKSNISIKENYGVKKTSESKKDLPTVRSAKSDSSLSSPKKTFFDYKGILTANCDLNEIVNQGGNLFFDCPPI